MVRYSTVLELYAHPPCENTVIMSSILIRATDGAISLLDHLYPMMFKSQIALTPY